MRQVKKLNGRIGIDSTLLTTSPCLSKWTGRDAYSTIDCTTFSS